MPVLREIRYLAYAAAPCSGIGASLAVREPGDHGSQSRTMRTKQLLAQYGDRLVCVRYRYDAQRKKRFKTVELIVAERDWDLPATRLADDAPVAVRIDFAEVELRQRVKQAGGRWTAGCGSCRTPRSSRSSWKPGSRSRAHPILDAVARPKGIHMQMRRRHPHPDACIQYWMPASDARFSTLQSNYS
jgi:hypothetical protein